MKNKLNCIYEITNSKDNFKYIGRTSDFRLRKNRHLNELRKNKHHNISIQRAFDLYGEDCFSFNIIEENLSIEDALIREQYYIDTEKFLYNINLSSTFGDAISKHPNKKEICSKIGYASRERILSMTSEEKEKRYGHTRGEGNPNYKNRGVNSPLYGVKKPEGFGEKISKAHKGKKLSEEHKSKMKFFKKGSEPWNKGKKGLQKWTKEQYEKRSKGLPQIRKKVSCEGTEFDSLTSASAFYGITSGAMHYRIKSTKDKFKEFYYL